MTAEPRFAAAQDALAHIAQGDAEQAARRLRQALVHYDAALTADSASHEALVRAAMTAVTLAEFHDNAAERDSLFARAARDARRAVAINPDDAEAQFALARALGRYALRQGMRERVKLAAEIRAAAERAVAINPNHAGALHVLGLWHQKVMELGGVHRLAARTLLGAKGLSDASWELAIAHLEAAVRAQPDAIVHRLNLGRLYAKRKLWDKARAQLEWVMAAPAIDYNDEDYRRQAAVALQKIKS